MTSASLQNVVDTAGPVGLALRAGRARQHAELATGPEQAFGPYSTGAGYELPGVVLCAIAV